MNHKHGLSRRTSSSLAMGLWLLAGCAGLAQAEEYDWPNMINIGSAGTLSGSFASTNAWAPVLQESIGATVRVIPEESEFNRHRRFAVDKQFDMASISSSEGALQLEGVQSYSAMPPNPQLVLWHNNDTPWGFVVRGDSDIKSLSDLKTKDDVKVAVFVASPNMTRIVKEALPGFLGMSPEAAAEAWTFISTGSYGENCRSVVEGKADITWCSPISSVTSELEGHPDGIRYVDMPKNNKKGWESWLQINPTHIPTKIDIGVSSAIGHEGIASSYLYWVRPDMEKEMAYKLAKWLDQNFDQYKDRHSLTKRMSLSKFREFLDVSPHPVHPGVVKYLREIGQWTDEDDQWNKQAKEKMNRWIAARKEVLTEAADKNVKPHWENKEFYEIYEKHTSEIHPFKARIE